jgi:hypothetical protein
MIMTLNRQSTQIHANPNENLVASPLLWIANQRQSTPINANTNLVASTPIKILLTRSRRCAITGADKRRKYG